ncbi:RcpC/CpaB family pilus assembly protein [Propionibacteriaceae bacterium Y1685]|uniref:RcpC/CpaB family pilus assembly protein n=1 Tax=Microlunatus sp. Y1700 TaxID=3418487 RepID=UPI003B7CCB1B
MTTTPVRTSPLAAVRRAVSWHRRKLAVLAAVIAVLAAVNAASPAPPATTAVVTATHALAGGHTVTAEDVRLTDMPDGVLPEQVLGSLEEVIGRTLAAPATAGQMITATDVVSPRMMLGDASTVVAPLRLSDAQVAGLLAVGDEVDVVAADPRNEGRTTVVAERARVVAIPSRAAGSSGPLGMGGGQSSSSGQLVLIAVAPAAAKQLATAASTSQLSIMWRS